MSTSIIPIIANIFYFLIKATFYVLFFLAVAAIVIIGPYVIMVIVLNYTTRFLNYHFAGPYPQSMTMSTTTTTTITIIASVIIVKATFYVLLFLAVAAISIIVTFDNIVRYYCLFPSTTTPAATPTDNNNNDNDNNQGLLIDFVFSGHVKRNKDGQNNHANNNYDKGTGSTINEIVIAAKSKAGIITTHQAETALVPSGIKFMSTPTSTSTSTSISFMKENNIRETTKFNNEKESFLIIDTDNDPFPKYDVYDPLIPFWASNKTKNDVSNDNNNSKSNK